MLHVPQITWAIMCANCNDLMWEKTVQSLMVYLNSAKSLLQDLSVRRVTEIDDWFASAYFMIDIDSVLQIMQGVRFA